MRKAHAILDYGILIVIVVGAIAGVNLYIKRAIQAQILYDARRSTLVQGLSAHPGPGQGLEWESSMTIGGSSSDINRHETPGQNLDLSSTSTSSTVTLRAPVPSIKGWSAMEHKGSALHVQDAPSAAPTPDYPDLEYKDFNDTREWFVPS